MDGGIARLLVLIAEHRGAVEYDFRTRCGIGLRDIGQADAFGRVACSITEAARFVGELLIDTSSHTLPAVRGWDFPASRAELALFDLFDLQQAKGVEKKARHRLKPYQRPWPDEKTTEQVGGGDVTDAQVIDLMARLGHNIAKP